MYVVHACIRESLPLNLLAIHHGIKLARRRLHAVNYASPSQGLMSVLLTSG